MVVVKLGDSVVKGVGKFSRKVTAWRLKERARSECQ